MGTFQERNILITGGLGFIGSNLARRILGLGAEITVVNSLIPEYGGNLFNISGIEAICREILSLPMHPYMIENDTSAISTLFIKFFESA